jgi:hypothetical protein
MKDNYNNIIRVFNKSKALKESSYFYNSSKDRSHKGIGVKQAFFEISIDKTRFPVLKSCIILRRTNNNTDIDSSPIEEHKMDPTDYMMIGNQDAIAHFPSTLQENNDSTLSATARDDDDATVQTSNSNSTKQAWKSYNIKLLLTNKQDTSDSALQHAMLTILATIDRELETNSK